MIQKYRHSEGFENNEKSKIGFLRRPKHWEIAFLSGLLGSEYWD
jgi:hypothetical protein